MIVTTSALVLPATCNRTFVGDAQGTFSASE
jgi:hypothetical protein